MVRVLFLTICLVALATVSSPGHEVTDRGGKHRIDAILVEPKKDAVHLEKAHENRAWWPEQQSRTDRDFLVAEADSPAKRKGTEARPVPAGALSGVTTFAGLEALVKKQTNAAAVVALYQLFLREAGVAQAEKDLAQADLPHWEDLKSAGAVRAGVKWLTAAELKQLSDAEEHLVVEASKLVETGNGPLAEAKLIAASKANPIGVTAAFLLGLYHALVVRSSVEAEKDFGECVKRLKHKDSLSNGDRANLVASLNNLAIVEARQRKHGSAVKHWKEAAQVTPAPIEVIQNVGRFVHLAHAAPMLGIPKDTEKSAGNLFASVASSAKGRSFSEHLGWLYIGVFAPEEKPDEDAPPKSGGHKPRGPQAPGGEPIVAGFGSGFVVKRGYVVTNHHVVEGADEIEIHLRRNQAVGHKGRVLALLAGRGHCLGRVHGADGGPCSVEHRSAQIGERSVGARLSRAPGDWNPIEIGQRLGLGPARSKRRQLAPLRRPDQRRQQRWTGV